jgi:hypothetical protein
MRGYPIAQNITSTVSKYLKKTFIKNCIFIISSLKETQKLTKHKIQNTK